MRKYAASILLSLYCHSLPMCFASPAIARALYRGVSQKGELITNTNQRILRTLSFIESPKFNPKMNNIHKNIDPDLMLFTWLTFAWYPIRNFKHYGFNVTTDEQVSILKHWDQMKIPGSTLDPFECEDIRNRLEIKLLGSSFEGKQLYKSLLNSQQYHYFPKSINNMPINVTRTLMDDPIANMIDVPMATHKAYGLETIGWWCKTSYVPNELMLKMFFRLVNQAIVPQTI